MSEPNILYIGCEPAITGIIESKLPNLTFTECYDGSEALEAITQKRDLIFLDPILPSGQNYPADEIAKLERYAQNHWGSILYEVGRYVLEQIAQSPNKDTPIMILKLSKVGMKIPESALGNNVKLLDLSERESLEAEISKALGIEL